MAAMPPEISLFYSIRTIITSRSHTHNNARLHRGRRNSLREENGIADTGRHGPIWHAIDAFFNVRANRVRQKVSRKTYLRLCILGIFGAHRFYAKQWVTGIFYLLTCWTGISIAMTIIDAITVIPMKPDENGMIEL